MVSIRFWTRYIDPYAVLDPMNVLVNQDIEGGVEVWTGKKWRPATKSAYDIVDWLDSNEYQIKKITLSHTKGVPWRGQYIAHYSKGSV